MRPLELPALEELALAYAARFATTAAKLEAYLARKLRERGWAGEGPPPVGAIVERFVAAGYVDDAAYARAKAGSLLRRGYGERRIGQALGAAGVEETLRDEVLPDEGEARRAALTLARKRGFGPFGRTVPDRPLREKQLAAMLRAGHRLSAARAMVESPTAEDAEGWAAVEEGNT